MSGMSYTRTRHIAAALVGIATLLALLAACALPTTEPATPTPMPQPLRLTIVHTNDNRGQTDPCG